MRDVIYGRPHGCYFSIILDTITTRLFVGLTLAESSSGDKIHRHFFLTFFRRDLEESLYFSNNFHKMRNHIFCTPFHDSTRRTTLHNYNMKTLLGVMKR